MNTDQQRIAARAETDADFRKRLNTDPQAAAAEELGRELSDAEMDELAGGYIPWNAPWLGKKWQERADGRGAVST